MTVAWSSRVIVIGEVNFSGTFNSANRTQSSSAASSLAKLAGAQPCQRAIHLGRSSVTQTRNAARMYSAASATSICNQAGGEPNMKSVGGDDGGEVSHENAASRIA